MVKRKRSSAGFSRRVRRRGTRRRMKYIGRTRIGKKGQVLYVKRKIIMNTNVPMNMNLGVGYAYAFALQDIQDDTELAALFDNYKLSRVKVKFMPVAAPIQSYLGGTATTPATYPTPFYMHGAIDTNDASDPTSADEVLQYQNCKSWRSDRGKKFYWKPSIEYSVDGHTAGVKPASYLDCAQKNIRHYGLKLWIEPMPNNNNLAAVNMTLRREITLYFKFKNQR